MSAPVIGSGLSSAPGRLSHQRAAGLIRVAVVYSAFCALGPAAGEQAAGEE